MDITNRTALNSAVGGPQAPIMCNLPTVSLQVVKLCEVHSGVHCQSVNKGLAPARYISTFLFHFGILK
jgi:hypothetical protein